MKSEQGILNKCNQSIDTMDCPKNHVLIKSIITSFVTGEQILYTVISTEGEKLAVFDSLKACKHFAHSHNYHYEFVH